MNSELSDILSDPEINRLTDMYLAFLDPDRNAEGYQRLKSAVMLSLRLDDMQQVYAELKKIYDCTAAEVERDIAGLINGLPAPIEQSFNEYYCAQAEMGFMPKHKTTDNTVAFLGKTLLYILETNYPFSMLNL